MKKVTIPTCANPFVVIVNGMKYTYPAGETVEVPDDVAAVIEQHDEAHNNPEPDPVLPPFTPETGEGHSKVIDLSKYAWDYGETFLQGMIRLFGSGGGTTGGHDNGALWTDLTTDKQVVFLFDGSLLQEGLTVEAPAVNIMKINNVARSVAFSFVLKSSQIMKITVYLGYYILADGTNPGTDISLVIEPLNVPST